MRSQVIREGVVAGSLGAANVAIWFFLIDLVRGRPFETPILLGQAFFGLFGAPAGSPPIALVLGYTAFHLLAFILAGLLVATILEHAQQEPTLLAGALILFVVFEVGFHALLSIFGSIPSLGVMAWYNVATGNLIAAATMGLYLWRSHPELKAELAHALSGEDQE